jgi:uncharacterized membrane protein YedE/YeeE
VTQTKRHSPPALVSAALAGLLFGAGLIVSGMSDPRKVLGFLDIAGNWDPSLAFVMGGAIAVALPAFAIARRLRARHLRALTGEPLPAPQPFRANAGLVIGSIAFGAGWGLAGFCPGPALLTFAAGNVGGIVFALAMFAGMAIHALLVSRSH